MSNPKRHSRVDKIQSFSIQLLLTAFRDIFLTVFNTCSQCEAHTEEVTSLTSAVRSQQYFQPNDSQNHTKDQTLA